MLILQTFFQTDFGLGRIGSQLNLGDASLITIITRIINTFLGLLGIIAMLMILYSGLMIMVSGTDDERRGRGYRAMGNAIVGIIIILSAFAIVNFLINSIGGATGAGLQL
jgi:type IV secretory pathway VirB2 component (pilin)